MMALRSWATCAPGSLTASQMHVASDTRRKYYQLSDGSGRAPACSRKDPSGVVMFYRPQRIQLLSLIGPIQIHNNADSDASLAFASSAHGVRAPLWATAARGAARSGEA